MLYYINAYKPDTAALYITCARIHELDVNAEIYIASDPASPVSGDIPGAQIITPAYPRGGNLRDPRCAIGMLQTMEVILKHKGMQYIVKIDADTFLNDIGWLALEYGRAECKGAIPDFVGMERAEVFSISGDCYRVSVWGIRAAIKHLSKRFNDTQGREALPEDVCIFNSVMRAQLPVCAIPFYRGLHRGISYSLPDDAFKHAYVVHCGEPLANGQRAPREMVYLRMQTMWQLVHPGIQAPVPR